MKFLLAAVNAKYIHSNPAIYSLRAGAGDKLRRHVELAEYTVNQRAQDILADICRRRPDAVGFSCYIWNWRLVRELLPEIPKLLPDAKLWLGGPEASFGPRELLRQFPMLSGIMVGEGEATFRELLEYYAEDGGEVTWLSGDAAETPERCLEEAPRSEETAGRRLEEIAGLCLPGGFTAPRAPADLSALPFPYGDLSPFENRIVYYETSRGCPFRCSYCLSSVDRTVRLRDIGAVKKELQFFLQNRVRQVKLVDRTFNCNHDHAMEIWRYIHEHDNGVTNFHFEISAELLREDEIELLHQFRPGLAQLEIGVQSANPRTLRAVRRNADLDRLERAVEALGRGKNIHRHLDLIAGLPYEDYESFGRSFDRVYRMRPEQLQLGFLKVLRGSPLWEEAREYGICHWDQPPYEVLSTRWLTYGELLRLKGVEEMVELYYNSAQFTRTLSFLERAFPGPFAMYEALWEHCGDRGLSGSPARASRYGALLEFAEKYDGSHSEIYRELLTFDMYLREKLKSRPDFAADISPFRERIAQVYRREERERVLLPAYGGCDRKQLGRMTHMEPFFYPVWDEEKMEAQGGPVRADVPVFVLFDYKKRNPLNYEADVQVISGTGETGT